MDKTLLVYDLNEEIIWQLLIAMGREFHREVAVGTKEAWLAEVL